MNRTIAPLFALLSFALFASCTLPAVTLEDPATIPIPQAEPAVSYSGIATVDAIIDAIEEEGARAVRTLAQFTEMACTTQDGLGGPPKCQPGQPEGTVVTVLPVWAQEEAYLAPDTMNTLRFDVRRVYAVYRVPDDAVRDDFTPPGEFGILFLNADPFPATITVYVTDGRIVRLSYNMDTDPALTLAQTGGDVLYVAGDAATPVESEAD